MKLPVYYYSSVDLENVPQVADAGIATIVCVPCASLGHTGAAPRQPALLSRRLTPRSRGDLSPPCPGRQYPGNSPTSSAPPSGKHGHAAATDFREYSALKSVELLFVDEVEDVNGPLEAPIASFLKRASGNPLPIGAALSRGHAVGTAAPRPRRPRTGGSSGSRLHPRPRAALCRWPLPPSPLLPLAPPTSSRASTTTPALHLLTSAPFPSPPHPAQPPSGPNSSSWKMAAPSAASARSRTASRLPRRSTGRSKTPPASSAPRGSAPRPRRRSGRGGGAAGGSGRSRPPRNPTPRTPSPPRRPPLRSTSTPPPPPTASPTPPQVRSHTSSSSPLHNSIHRVLASRRCKSSPPAGGVDGALLACAVLLTLDTAARALLGDALRPRRGRCFLTGPAGVLLDLFCAFNLCLDISFLAGDWAARWPSAAAPGAAPPRRCVLFSTARAPGPRPAEKRAGTATDPDGPPRSPRPSAQERQTDPKVLTAIRAARISRVLRLWRAVQAWRRRLARSPPPLPLPHAPPSPAAPPPQADPGPASPTHQDPDRASGGASADSLAADALDCGVAASGACAVLAVALAAPYLTQTPYSAEARAEACRERRQQLTLRRRCVHAHPFERPFALAAVRA